MNIADRAERLAGRAGGMLETLRRQIEALLTPWRVSRRLFTDPATGALTPDAVAFFGRLARTCHVDGSAYHPDAREHARREGRREVALEIMGQLQLNQERLAALLEQTRQGDDDDGYGF
jgi:hypothetical protein